MLLTWRGYTLSRPSRDGIRSERDREKARGISERERDAEHRGSGKESSHSGRRSRDERADRNDQQRDPEVTPRRRGDSPDDSRRRESRTDRDDRQRSKGDEPRRREDSPEPSKRRDSRSDRGGDERQRERRREDDRERAGVRDRKGPRNRCVTLDLHSCDPSEMLHSRSSVFVSLCIWFAPLVVDKFQWIAMCQIH